MSNFKNPLPVNDCPRCGRRMEFGERVKVNLQWEYGGSYRNRHSTSGMLCRECASQVANFARIGKPEVA